LTNIFFFITKAKLENGAGSNNLTIWDAKTGEEIAAFSQKAQNNW
jgi:translation initiation factor 2A